MNEPMANTNVFTVIGASSHSNKARAPHDFYAIDPKALEMLLDLETFNKNIWECACGQGHLSRVLEARGYNVVSTDLVDRGYGTANVDFLQCTEYFDGDIITNPPYNLAINFVKHALDLVPAGNKVAMFLKLTFLESQSRRKFFDESPPKIIYVSSGRLKCGINGDFNANSSSAVAYAWFVWIKGFTGSPQVKWFN